MKKLGDLIMILDLHRQGLKVAMIARQVGADRKTARKYIARGLKPPCYGPRLPRARTIDEHVAYLRARLEQYPRLTAQRLLREMAARGYSDGRNEPICGAPCSRLCRKLRHDRLCP